MTNFILLKSISINNSLSSYANKFSLELYKKSRPIRKKFDESIRLII